MMKDTPLSAHIASKAPVENTLATLGAGQASVVGQKFLNTTLVRSR